MGEERDPEMVVAIERGMQLFNAREFYEAHEIWEQQWGISEMQDRHLLQGLIQVAAAFYKLQTGMPTGTVKLLEKAVGHLHEVPANFYDLDLSSLLDAVEHWRVTAKSMVEQWRTDFDKNELPVLSFRSH